MITHEYLRKFLGQFIECHTHYGAFQGIIVKCTKHHIILGRMPTPQTWRAADIDLSSTTPASYFPRHIPMRPGGPGSPMGPGGPGFGGGWHMAIPLAAILGITALGMHWW